MPTIPKLIKGEKQIEVIDLEKMEAIKKIPTLGNNTGMSIRPDDKILYTTNYSMNFDFQNPTVNNEDMYKSEFLIIDAKKDKVIKKIDFSKYQGARSVAFTPNGRKAYIVCGTEDQAIVLDGQAHKIIKTIKLDLGG